MSPVNVFNVQVPCAFVNVVCWPGVVGSKSIVPTITVPSTSVSFVLIEGITTARSSFVETELSFATGELFTSTIVTVAVCVPDSVAPFPPVTDVISAITVSEPS